MALQQPGLKGRLPEAPLRSRSSARRAVTARAGSSPTRPPPAQPTRRPFSSPLPQWQKLWAVAGGKQGREAAHPSLIEQRAEGHLAWADGMEEHYRTGKTVGRGAFGTVRLARSKRTSELVAVKVLSKSRPGQSKGRTAGKLAREADCMAAVQDCEGVVRLRGLYEDATSAYMVMDHCTGGDLEELVQKKGALAEHRAAVVLFEVLKVVASCHRRSVCHGDIKPANFLLAKPLDLALHNLQPGDRPPAGWLKAIDFGCAQQLVGEKPLTRRTGTPVYMAPEVFKRNYSSPADMWSVGMLMYHLLSARFPFWADMKSCQAASLEEVMDRVTRSDILLDFGPFLKLSPEGHELLRSLLVRDPAKRLTAEAALESDWFKMHLGWEADAPRVVHSVLPQLVSRWAAGDASASVPHPAAATAPTQPPQLTLVLEAAAAQGAPAPTVVSPRPVKTTAKAAGEPVVASNIVSLSHKEGSATASGGASPAEERKGSGGSNSGGTNSPATSSGGSKAGRKRVSRKAVSTRAKDSARARSAELQTACGYS